MVVTTSNQNVLINEMGIGSLTLNIGTALMCSVKVDGSVMECA